MEIKSKYIECSCKSLEHLIRISYDNEDTIYYLEYRLYNNIKEYFKNVWRAITNQQRSYVIDTILEKEEMIKICNFVSENN
jgi:hypothetical protein